MHNSKFSTDRSQNAVERLSAVGGPVQPGLLPREAEVRQGCLPRAFHPPRHGLEGQQHQESHTNYVEMGEIT